MVCKCKYNAFWVPSTGTGPLSISIIFTSSANVLNKYVLCVWYVPGSVLTLGKEQETRLGS